MKKTRLLNNRELKHRHNPAGGASQEQNDYADPISTKSVKKRLSKVTDNGFNVFDRKLKPTEEGMKAEVQEFLVLNGSGRVMREVGGKCCICNEYYERDQLLSCYVQGCENKSLCPKDVRFFDNGEKQVPYCPRCYEQAVKNYDTWEATERKRKNKNGKQ